jgi:hypothetical protein
VGGAADPEPASLATWDTALAVRKFGNIEGKWTAGPRTAQQKAD